MYNPEPKQAGTALERSEFKRMAYAILTLPIPFSRCDTRPGPTQRRRYSPVTKTCTRGVLCRRNPYLHTLKAVEAKTEEELQRDRREQKEMMIQQDLDRVMVVQKDLGRDMDKMQRELEKMHTLTLHTLNDIQDRLPKQTVRPHLALLQ